MLITGTSGLSYVAVQPHMAPPSAAIVRKHEPLPFPTAQKPAGVSVHVQAKPPHAEADDMATALKERRSAAFETAFTAKLAEARAYLLSLPLGQRQNGAVVMDIDETIADTSDYYETEAFKTRGFVQADWNTWMTGVACGKRPAKTMPGSIAFIRWLKQQGISVYLVSSRSDTLLQETRTELTQLGLNPDDMSGLYLKPKRSPEGITEPTYMYKQRIRECIELESGRDIMASVGDQKADIWGKHTGKGFLLPNPLYDFTRVDPLPPSDVKNKIMRSLQTRDQK